MKTASLPSLLALLDAFAGASLAEALVAEFVATHAALGRAVALEALAREAVAAAEAQGADLTCPADVAEIRASLAAGAAWADALCGRL
jgi:hypothetical protein